MPRDIKEDIYTIDNSYAYLSLFTKNLKVGIVGGGRAAYIKAKTFVERGALIEVLAMEISQDILTLTNTYRNINIIEGKYKEDFINDKHLIIIAIDDFDAIKKIIDDCEKNYKIYINSANYTNGMGMVPYQRETKSTMFAVNSKIGNPKGTIFIGEKIKETINEYDGFLDFLSQNRKWLKNNKNKVSEKQYSELLTFINSDEFYYFYSNGYGKQVIEMFLQD